MKKIILLTFFLSITIISFSQNTGDSAKYKFYVATNIESMLNKDFKLSLWQKISRTNFLEVMLSYNLPYHHNFILKDDNSSWRLYDPFFYYGRYQVRLGLKNYSYYNRNLFTGPVFTYSYGQFKYRPASYVGKYSQLLDRKKKVFESFYEAGITSKLLKHLIQETYVGLGVRVMLLDDTIYNDISGNTNTPKPDKTYPYKLNTTRIKLTFHLGFKLGFGF